MLQMNNNNALYSIIFCSLTAFLCYCTSNKISGGAVEDGNAVSVTGTVLGDSSMVSSAIVSLIPSDFNPVSGHLPDSLSDTTDTDGKFYFSLIPTDLYNIFYTDSIHSTANLQQHVLIDKKTTLIELDSMDNF
jgi:hypothetical protein